MVCNKTKTTTTTKQKQGTFNIDVFNGLSCEKTDTCKCNYIKINNKNFKNKKVSTYFSVD